MTAIKHKNMRDILSRIVLLFIILLAGCNTVAEHTQPVSGPLAVRWMRSKTGAIRIEVVNRAKEPIMVRLPYYGFNYQLTYLENGELKYVAQGSDISPAPHLFVVLDSTTPQCATYDPGDLANTEHVGTNIVNLTVGLEWISVAEASRALMSGGSHVQLVDAIHAELGTDLTDIPIGAPTAANSPSVGQQKVDGQ